MKTEFYLWIVIVLLASGWSMTSFVMKTNSDNYRRSLSEVRQESYEVGLKAGKEAYKKELIEYSKEKWE